MQVDGVAVGSPLIPTLDNIFLVILKRIGYKTSLSGMIPLFYLPHWNISQPSEVF